MNTQLQRTARSRFARQRGFSMLEILITLFLLDDVAARLRRRAIVVAAIQQGRSVPHAGRLLRDRTSPERMQANKTGATARQLRLCGRSR